MSKHGSSSTMSDSERCTISVKRSVGSTAPTVVATGTLAADGGNSRRRSRDGDDASPLRGATAHRQPRGAHRHVHHRAASPHDSRDPRPPPRARAELRVPKPRRARGSGHRAPRGRRRRLRALGAGRGPHRPSSPLDLRGRAAAWRTYPRQPGSSVRWPPPPPRSPAPPASAPSATASTSSASASGAGRSDERQERGVTPQHDRR